MLEDNSDNSEKFIEVYQDLRRIAQSQLKSYPAIPLNATGIVHEVFLKIYNSSMQQDMDPLHFKRMCSKAIRHVLIDLARNAKAQKRGGHMTPVTFPLSLVSPNSYDAIDLLVVDDIISSLGDINPDLEEVAQHKFYSGLDLLEIAEIMDSSLRTTERRWARAKAYLIEALGL